MRARAPARARVAAGAFACPEPLRARPPLIAPRQPPAARRAPARPRRLVFLGTPEMAVPPLRALHAAGFEIALVVTRADKRRGGGAAPRRAR